MPGCDARAPRCGDGVVQPGEETCDDGTNNGAYGGCMPGCDALGPRCGDGVVQPGEETCDSGTNNGAYGTCMPGCDALAPRCGDGIIQVGEEVCDDGLNNGSYGGCMPGCDARAPYCGDGVKNGTEACDGAAFGTATCATLAAPKDSGTLACTSNCLSILTTGCYEYCNNSQQCDLAGESCVDNRCVSGVTGTCATAIALPGDGTRLDTTLGRANDLDGASCPGIPVAQTAGPDKVYRMDLAAHEALRVELRPDGWDGLLYLATDCASVTTTCLAGRDLAYEAGVPERLHWVAGSAATTLYLMVDGAAAGDGGAFELVFTRDASAVAVSSDAPVLVSELMPDPYGNRYRCQWLELHNPNPVLLDLEGLLISGGLDAFLIDAPLLVPAGGFVLLGTTGEPSLNCGLPPLDWRYEGIDLSALGPYQITIETGSGSVLDQVSYDATWPYDDGVSAALCPAFMTAAGNDDASHWVESVDPYATGSFGTPGAANPDLCP
jgi:hypothetical protein